eukprot:230844_1
MPLYNTKEYWNARYFDELDYFDWYCSYIDIQDSINNILRKLSVIFSSLTLNILDFGCGTSLLSHHIFKQYENVNILAIDSSKNGIQFMNYNKNKTEQKNNNKILEYKHIIFETMSCNPKSSNHCKYHLIIDKATTDSLLCGVGGIDKTQKLINSNIYKLLSMSGIYLLITHSPNRYQLFIKSKWALNRIKIEIPYFKHINDTNDNILNPTLNTQITNDIKKYLNENNRILINYLPTQQIDESQNYLSLMNQKEEKKIENESKDNKQKNTEIKPIIFDLKPKTANELLEERRKRRLEYEASLNKAREQSEKFRQEFLKKQKEKEEKRKKEEELKNRKIIINVDEILNKKKDSKIKNKQSLNKYDNEYSDESDEYGGYMTDSSEEDKKKEKEREQMLLKLIQQDENVNKKEIKKKKNEKKKKKKKYKNKN